MEIDTAGLEIARTKCFQRANGSGPYTDTEKQNWLNAANEIFYKEREAAKRTFVGLDDQIVTLNAKIRLTVAVLEEELQKQESVAEAMKTLADMVSILDQLIVLAGGLFYGWSMPYVVEERGELFFNPESRWV
jgi:hypothetical protein